MLNHCFKTQTVYFRKLKLMMLWRFLYGNRNLFDFSDYPQDSKFLDLANEKVIGKMKDQFKDKRISEFVRLKSKIYFLIVVDSGEINKIAKGVNKNVEY